MVALLVGLSVMAVLMSVALPVWNKQAQREREEEYLFRAHEYARGILKFQRKAGPGTLPPTLDLLVEQRFVRRKYKDPLTGQDFQPVYQTAAPIGGSGGAAGGFGSTPPGGTATGGGTPSGGLGGTSTQQTGGTSSTGQTAAMPGAPVIGVVSKSKATSIKIYNGRTRYDQWAVTWQDVKPGKGLPPDILQAINQATAQQGQGGLPGQSGAGGAGGQNPFGQRGAGNPFGQPQQPGAGNPFGQPGAGNPFGQPIGQPGANPFGTPGTNPFQSGGGTFTPAYPPPPGQTGSSPFGAPPPKKQ